MFCLQSSAVAAVADGNTRPDFSAGVIPLTQNAVAGVNGEEEVRRLFRHPIVAAENSSAFKYSNQKLKN